MLQRACDLDKEFPTPTERPMNVPFSAHNTSSDPNSLNNRHRLELYRKFMKVKYLNWIGNPTLDVGAPNFIGQSLCADVFTHRNLNLALLDYGNFTKYKVITCFEVIQHVMNPLQLMANCYNALDEGGLMYVATPKQWLIPWYHGLENFTEYKPENLEQMFRYVGFEIVRRETHNPWPIRFMFYGVRPFFRVLLNRFVIWELRKP